MQIAKYFIRSAGVIFLIIGVAKIISSFGTTPDLQMLDPIFHFQFRQLMFWIGVVELALSFLCFQNKIQSLALWLTAWMAINYLIYQAGLVFLHWNRPCICMGYLTEGLGVPPWLAECISRMLVIYLLIGSYGILFYQWRGRKPEVRTKRDEMKADRGSGS